jgi:hypothetical protein
MSQILIVLLLIGIFLVLLNIDHNLCELGKLSEQIKFFMQRRDK